MLISRYFIPIIPSIDWFYRLLLQSILSYVIYSFVSNEYFLRVERKQQKKIKKQTCLYVCGCLIVVVVGLFIVGFFKYQPIAVLTYSMEPTFTRGDAVIVQKLSSGDILKLKKGDVIQYKKDNIVVIHRIMEAYYKNGETIFILKGDNNKSADNEPVYSEQILGKVMFSIPKIGYPSVWLNEFLFSDNNISIEVGR